MSSVSGRPDQPGRTVLRIAAIRWLIAELLPFGCLAIGFVIAREWRPVVATGFAFAIFGGFVLSIFYLCKVLGAAVGWVLAIFPQFVGIAWAGAVTLVGSAVSQSPQHPAGVKIVATSSWWIAGACLAATLGVTVAGAVLTGERWLQRGGRALPLKKWETLGRARGSLAWLWLPGPSRT